MTSYAQSQPERDDFAAKGRPAGDPTSSWLDPLASVFYRIAADGWISPRWFQREAPRPENLPARTGRLEVEIVSHCWRYAHLLAYQLSSLVLHPPEKVTVRMTVFHALEDEATVATLRRFDGIVVPNVTWNWWPLERPQLMRRAIGRNLAALASRADWVWFTDCDVLFQRGCLNALGDALQGRRDVLVFPREEQCTPLLAADDPMLRAGGDPTRLVEIDPTRFYPHQRGRATGPIQITHGDVARRFGYCAALPYYQKPAARWQKAYEDRAFRWLLRTHGVPIDVPGVFRIRHAEKGRYRKGHWLSSMRGFIRHFGGDASRTPRPSGTTC